MEEIRKEIVHNPKTMKVKITDNVIFNEVRFEPTPIEEIKYNRDRVIAKSKQLPRKLFRKEYVYQKHPKDIKWDNFSTPKQTVPVPEAFKD